MKTEIRAMTIGDYDDAVALWNSVEGVGLDDADTYEKVDEYLVRNPGLSFVAHLDGRMVGAVLCGHDGRRGYLHHLAVAHSCREQGLGKAMVERCLSALREIGIERCNIFVIAENEEGKAFWQATGWAAYPDLLFMTKATQGEASDR